MGDFEGSLKKQEDVFTVRFGKVYITMKVTELIPDQKIVWYVTDCNKPWLKNKKEWQSQSTSFKPHLFISSDGYEATAGIKISF